jgi:hypothetical protein
MRAVEQVLGNGNVLSRSVISAHLGAPVVRDGVSLRGAIDFDWFARRFIVTRLAVASHPDDSNAIPEFCTSAFCGVEHRTARRP